MVLLDRVGREVVRGSITRDHWLANVTVMAPDRVPLDEAAPVFIEVEWRRRPDEGTEPALPDDAQPTTLSFEPRSGATAGRIHWDAAGTRAVRGFEGVFRGIVECFGTHASIEGPPDVRLVLRIEDEERESVTLSVGPSTAGVAIRAEHGSDPARARITAGRPVRFTAVPAPDANASGSFRWLSVTPDALELRGDADGATVEVVGRTVSADPRRLLVLFTPADGSPARMAVHELTVTEGVSLVDTPVLHFTLRWPDARTGDPAFAGTALAIPAGRVPYLHPTQPASYRETITLGATPEARPLAAGAGPGEFLPELRTEVVPGRSYYLVVPEHVFARVEPDAAQPWRRRLRFQDVAAGGDRVFAIPVVLRDDVLMVTPIGEAEQPWGDAARDLFAVAIVPYLADVATGALTEDWHRGTRDLRTAVGEYAPFAESELPFHRPLTAAELAAAQAQHAPPVEFLRFPDVAERTFTTRSPSLFLESFLWRQETLDGAAPAAGARYLPLPKGAFWEGLEALRAAFGAATELEIVTGFVPPNRLAAARALRAVGGQSGYRVNQLRHAFGDAADVNRAGASFNTQPNRVAAWSLLLPWPDTPAAQALRGHFSLMQFERVMVNTGPATIARQYVLHVDRRDYDVPFYAGIYNLRVNDLTAANGHQAIHNDLAAANGNYADIVATVAQAPGTRPNAFYPSQLNAAPPHGHPVFGGINANPNLDALLTLLDGAQRFATIDLQIRDVGHDVDVEAIVREVFDIYGAHDSFLGVSFDLEWYEATVPPDATALVQALVPWIRANHPGKFLFPIWFSVTVARLNWAAITPLRDVVVPIYDGAPRNAAGPVNWGNALRNMWGGLMLDTGVLQHVWDSNRNLPAYGHNLLLPAAIPNAEFPAALSWLGRMSLLYGCTSFAFQFNEYGQHWDAHTADLNAILTELGA